jgi:hypothetical protein
MPTITITEALAELRTLSKRIEKKQEFILGNLARQDGLKDPHAESGGSAKLVSEALQSISDLEDQELKIRTAIQASNLQTTLSVEGVSHTIAEWILWKRNISGSQKQRLSVIANTLKALRQRATQQGNAVVTINQQPTALTDLVVFVSESDLAQKSEWIETVLGSLDGQLTLANSRTTITY